MGTVLNTVKITPRLGTAPVIEIDGHEFAPACRGVDIRLRHDEIPTVELDLLLLDLDPIEGDMRVAVPEVAAIVLEKLGWTRPQ